MTDRQILLAWKGGGQIHISREDKLYLFADRATGNGGSVRCVREIPLDADDDATTEALRLLAEDVLIGEVQFPPHLVQLGKLSHGI